MYKKLAALILAVVISGTAMAATKHAKQITGTVNINSASVSEIMLLPGVGKSKAEAVIAYRQKSPFKSPQEITKVKGIGPKMFAKIQQYVAIDGTTTAKVVK